MVRHYADNHAVENDYDLRHFFASMLIESNVNLKKNPDAHGA